MPYPPSQTFRTSELNPWLHWFCKLAAPHCLMAAPAASSAALPAVTTAAAFPSAQPSVSTLTAALHRIPKPAFGAVALFAAWLTGTAALDAGLIHEGADIFATLSFLAACALWLYAQIIFRSLPHLRFAAPILLGWWSLNLALSAAVAGADVYRTIFFATSAMAVTALILYSLTVSLLPRIIAFLSFPEGHADFAEEHSARS